MKIPKPAIKSLTALEAEMKSVAGGARRAPPDAHQPSFSSGFAVLGVLTVENRKLLKLLKTHGPQTVLDLAERSKRSPSDLRRALTKLRAAGLVEVGQAGSQHIWAPIVRRLVIEIDPYA